MPDRFPNLRLMAKMDRYYTLESAKAEINEILKRVEDLEAAGLEVIRAANRAEGDEGLSWTEAMSKLTALVLGDADLSPKCTGCSHAPHEPEQCRGFFTVQGKDQPQSVRCKCGRNSIEVPNA